MNSLGTWQNGYAEDCKHITSTEWLHRGLQIPYFKGVFPYKQYNKVTLQVQVQSTGYSLVSRD